jgi:hypothetical protein
VERDTYRIRNESAVVLFSSRLASSADAAGMIAATASDKRVFYEQVAGVKVLFFCLFLHLAFVVRLVAPHLALHRVPIRTRCELT